MQDNSSHQILDLTLDVDTDTFYAAGSTILEPPLFFAPVVVAGKPIAFTPVNLAPEFPYEGEMFAVAATATTVIVGGVDEGSDDGRFYVIDSGDNSVTGEFFVSSLVTSAEVSIAAVRGACASAAGFAVVGDEPNATGHGWVLTSTDGVAWTDATPPDVSDSVSKCVIANGTLIVSGSGGYTASHGFP